MTRLLSVWRWPQPNRKSPCWPLVPSHPHGSAEMAMCPGCCTTDAPAPAKAPDLQRGRLLCDCNGRLCSFYFYPLSLGQFGTKVSEAKGPLPSIIRISDLKALSIAPPAKVPVWVRTLPHAELAIPHIFVQRESCPSNSTVPFTHTSIHSFNMISTTDTFLKINFIYFHSI